MFITFWAAGEVLDLGFYLAVALGGTKKNNGNHSNASAHMKIH